MFMNLITKTLSQILPFLLTVVSFFFFFFFFNDPATTEIYTLSLHDALPICPSGGSPGRNDLPVRPVDAINIRAHVQRSEEHTSELQSHVNLVCRLLLEKKKNMWSIPVCPC